MPNLAYNRGVRRERDLVNHYRSIGWDSFRSAGSHSPWDVVAYNPTTGEVVLYQLKSQKGGTVIVDKVLSQLASTVKTIWRTVEVKKCPKTSKRS